jgi:hypothetical protein
MQITLDPVLCLIGSFQFRWYNLILIISLAIGFVVLLLEPSGLDFPALKRYASTCGHYSS